MVSELQRALLAKERLKGSSATGLPELSTLHGCSSVLEGCWETGFGPWRTEQQSLWPPYSHQAGPGRLSIMCFTFFLLRRDYKNPHPDLLPLQFRGREREERLGQPP